MSNRSIFGWSYPPGCSGPPEYDEEPCEICGEHIDNCICPECPVCGAVGDPLCYKAKPHPYGKYYPGHHGMVRTEEQKFLMEVNERAWEKDIRAENAYWDQYANDSITSEAD
jgi:hypothetical protein